jgi:hypothetical protein
MSDDEEAQEYATFDPTKHKSTQGNKVVIRLMDIIEESLAARLNAVDNLISKNRRELAKVKTDIEKTEKVVDAVSKSCSSNKLTDEIRLLFALARTDRLDLVGKVSNTSYIKPLVSKSPQISRTKTPNVNIHKKETYHQTAGSKIGRKYNQNFNTEQGISSLFSQYRRLQ